MSCHALAVPACNGVVDIHFDIFDSLFRKDSFSRDWLSSGPPEEWVGFFNKYNKISRNPFSLSYKLGNDLDYLTTHITLQLSRVIESRINDQFSKDCDHIPVPILASSVSACFSGLVISWFTRFQSIDPKTIAGYIHRLIKNIFRVT